MCGIAGLIHRDGATSVGSEMTAMLQSLRHRGPDSTGFAIYGMSTDDEYKRDEWERFLHTATEWDLKMYLDCLP